MKTKLYYFSGSGNCLAIAKSLHNKLESSELISIPKAMNEKEINGDTIGIIAPIYMHNMPHIVADFIAKIKSASYIFFVYGGAGELGKGIKRTFKQFEDNNLKLSSLFNIAMPSNYTPYGCPSEDQQKNLLAKVNTELDEIAETIQYRKEFIGNNKTSFFKSNIFPGALYKLGYPRIYMMDNNFKTDDTCDGCSICKNVCPVNNISMAQSKPQWHNKCQQCYACLQWCPKQSIQAGKKTLGVSRYHHPEIKVKEIVNSAAETY